MNAMQALREIQAYFQRVNVKKQTLRPMDLVEQLSEDIVIYEILPRIDCLSWARAACVCKAWRDLIRQVLPPPDIPWVWLTDPRFNNSFFYPIRTSTSSMFKEVRVGSTIASYQQYLLNIAVPPSCTTSSMPCNITIYNPFTSQTIQLPPLPGQLPRIVAGALSCLNKSQQFIAAVLNDAGTVHTWRRWNRKWVASFHTEKSVDDLVFWRGRLYFVCSDRKVMAVDVLKFGVMDPRIVVPSRENEFLSTLLRSKPFSYFVHYFVESCHEELLVVTRCNFKPSTLLGPIFTVHRVDFFLGKLDEIRDLGDQMLFLGQGCSRCTWYQTHAWHSGFFTKNSIYFLERNGKSSQFSLGKFSLTNGQSLNSVVFHPDQFPSSFSPIWITKCQDKF